MIFVTGASGFIGLHLCAALRQQELEFVAFGGSSEAPIQSIEGVSPQIVNGDTSQFCRLAARFNPDVIIHLAALANTTACERAPESARAVNETLVGDLIGETSNAIHIYVSTDLVFEGRAAPIRGIGEDEQPEPRSVYSRTKLGGERLTLSAGPRNLVARICLAYGSKFYTRGCFIHWIIDALRNGQSVKLFVDEFRTAIFVGDVVEGLINLSRRVMGQGLCSEQRIFHLAGPERMSRYDFGRQLAELLGLNASLIVARSRQAMAAEVYRAEDVSLDGGNTWKLLGISPRALSEVPLELIR